MNEQKEKDFLDNMAETYAHGLVSRMVKDSYLAKYKPYIENKNDVLEMGCSDGYSSIEISKMVKNLDVVDGSKKMIALLNESVQKNNIHNINAIYSLFEDYSPDKTYDAICCSFVLEHVVEPVEILKKANSLLKENGVLAIAVPNAGALSRRMAVSMGLMDNLYDLTENDLRHGHRRVYDMDKLEKDVKRAGLNIIKKGGVFLKQFADFQLELMIKHGIIGNAQILGMQKMGDEFPELSGSIYLISSK